MFYQMRCTICSSDDLSIIEKSFSEKHFDVDVEEMCFYNGLLSLLGNMDLRVLGGGGGGLLSTFIGKGGVNYR